jgi:hypothetical protein
MPSTALSRALRPWYLPPTASPPHRLSPHLSPPPPLPPTASPHAAEQVTMEDYPEAGMSALKYYTIQSYTK